MPITADFLTDISETVYPLDSSDALIVFLEDLSESISLLDSSVIATAFVNDISETVDDIVAQVESVRELIFTENDDFDQQFKG